MIKTILLAEDDRGSALLVKTILQKHGYYVLLAANGIEALQIINKQPVDLVITDVVMPQMDGVDLYDELKKRENTQHLPVIIITDKQVFMDAFSALGVEHFISKSGDINALLDKIKNISVELQKKKYLKVLVSGGNRSVVEQMRKMLVTQNCLVSTADNSLDTLQKAFLMTPHIVLLDLRMSDHAHTKEVVEALRCFHFFHSLKILTYAYLTPEEMVNADILMSIIVNDAAICREIGDTKFIGNFSSATFLESIQEYV